MESIFISKSKRETKLFPMILTRLIYYSFGLLYLIRAPSSVVAKLNIFSDATSKFIFFLFMITVFLIISIKIPEITAQAATQSNTGSIIYHDKSIQHISNPNTNQRGLQELIRPIPVHLDILLAVSTIFIGIIIMVL